MTPLLVYLLTDSNFREMYDQQIKRTTENQQHEEKQMTATLTGASSANDQWSSINWKEIESQVCRLQMRIAKANS